MVTNVSVSRLSTGARPYWIASLWTYRLNLALNKIWPSYFITPFIIIFIISNFFIVGLLHSQARIQTTAKYARAEVRFYICDVIIIPAYITMLLAV